MKHEMKCFTMRMSLFDDQTKKISHSRQPCYHKTNSPKGRLYECKHICKLIHWALPHAAWIYMLVGLVIFLATFYYTISRRENHHAIWDYFRLIPSHAEREQLWTVFRFE